MATGMFSTKGMYALRAMADLASHEGWVSLGDSKRQNISRKYLEQVISLMHKAGVAGAASAGKGGGYKLTRKPEEYTLGELLRAAEGSLAPVGCLDCSNGTICPQMGSCSTSVWRDLGRRDLLLPRLKDAGGPSGSRRGLLRRHLQRQVAPARDGTSPAKGSATLASPGSSQGGHLHGAAGHQQYVADGR